jgi:hypothetical protein
MDQGQQRTFDALRRVQDFLDGRAELVGELKESDGRTQLDEAVRALTKYAGDQAATNLALAGQIRRQRVLEGELRARHMQPIAMFARAKLRDAPDFAALVKSGAKLQPKQLVRAARAMAQAAASKADVLTRAGFPADTLAQLSVAVSALDAVLAERANATVRRVGSTKGIREELAKGREAARILNAVVRKRFVGNETFLAAWDAAYRVEAKSGATAKSDAQAAD